MENKQRPGLKRRSPRRMTNCKDEMSRLPNFIPYSTMFKLEEPPRPGNEAADVKRELECVSCGGTLQWHIYSVAPAEMDAECPMCHVKARNFWKGKLHKELDADA